jgi:pyridoxine 5-phosphate synthase
MTELRLGVNIDHIATLRQARMAHSPDPVAAAAIATLAGADGITVHLRGDRRHIQERDVELLRRTVRTHLNVEMAATDAMVALMVKLKPDAVCLVPENPDEVSTEGGLDLFKTETAVRHAAKQLKAAGIAVTCFIEPDQRQIKLAKQLGADSIELNTKAYSEAGPPARPHQLKRLRDAAKLGNKLGLAVHAGHGLDYFNVGPVAAIEGIRELNIGHAIIAAAVMAGLDRAVRDMKALLNLQ